MPTEQEPLSTDPAAGELLSAEPAAGRPDVPHTALWLAALQHAVPVAGGMAAELATNPQVPYAAAKIGRAVGAVAPIAVGAQTGGPVGALAGMAASAKGAWAGGKTGWFTGKLAQDVARPVARTLDKAGPLADIAGKVAGVQGALELAQMAEPNRKDIGFLGLAPSVPDLEILTAAVSKGANPASAAAAIAKGDPKRFGALMTAYMRSKQVQP